MRISEIEIHEFAYEMDDVGGYAGHRRYVPGSTMRSPGFVLTIRTADGTEGHYRGFMFTPPMVAQIRMVAPELLVGRDPLEREGIWQELWQALRHTDHLGVGPIDVALWDLAGRHYDESISSLLGGYRQEIPAYASTYFGDEAEGGLNSPAAYADFAETCRDRGYPGFKIHPFGDPDRDAEICRAVADRVGEGMDLMLDPASLYQSYADTLRVGRVMDECGFFWYEDPMADTGESMAMEKKLAGELDTPILGVEHVRSGAFGRADHLAAGALDLVRGDAHLDGGITGLMKIASTVEAFGLDVEPHVGGPAHLHCLSAIRNASYFEHGLLHPEIEWMSASGFTEPVAVPDDDGRVAVPDGPGLGVEIDWDYVEANATRHTLIDGSGAGAFA
jgi:L-alanine-DL-glutamate epimerase-like enolase superfamily enzyme